MRRAGVLVIAAAAAAGIFGECGREAGYETPPPSPHPRRADPVPDPLALIPNPRSDAERIVNGAKEEARRGVLYDASYQRIAYPGGDVPADRGACTDVIVRALRRAGHDLQQLIHEDRRRHRGRYGGGPADANVDHRRIPNHLAFLRRHARELPTATEGAGAATWQPGDLVYWRFPNGLNHCGVVSDVRRPDGLPLVIHNLSVATQEDCLTRWPITGHFRYPGGLHTGRT